MQHGANWQTDRILSAEDHTQTFLNHHEVPDSEALEQKSKNKQ